MDFGDVFGDKNGPEIRPYFIRRGTVTLITSTGKVWLVLRSPQNYVFLGVFEIFCCFWAFWLDFGDFVYCFIIHFREVKSILKSGKRQLNSYAFFGGGGGKTSSKIMRKKLLKIHFFWSIFTRHFQLETPGFKKHYILPKKSEKCSKPG